MFLPLRELELYEYRHRITFPFDSFDTTRNDDVQKHIRVDGCHWDCLVPQTSERWDKDKEQLNEGT